MSRRYDVGHAGATYVVEVLGNGEMRVDGRLLRIEALESDRCLVTGEDGTRTIVARAGSASSPWLFAAGQAWQVEVAPDGPRRRASTTDGADMSAPMPATVVAIAAGPGAHVAAGDPVIVLEAMKMELVVRAPRDGAIAAVHCRVGELVRPGVPLAELTA
jgi:biotin carboxyl carrier protein